MNYLELFEIFECVQKLDCKSPDKIVVKPIEIIDLQKLKQVHRKSFERHAEMFSENDIILNMNNIHYIFMIMLS